MLPTATVVCCVRNGESHLAQLGEHLSAIADEGVDFLLVDDASSDDTGVLFDRMAASLPRTRVLHRGVSEGVGVAQEYGVSAASGEYVWLIDCDDRFPPDALRILREGAAATVADVVVARAVISDGAEQVGPLIDAKGPDGVISGSNALLRLLQGEIEGYTWTKLFRRSLFDEASFHDDARPPAITTQSDFCRTATALARSRHVLLLHRVVYEYVRHGSSTMDRKDPPLENLGIARDHAVALARRVLPPTPDLRRRLARFSVWFAAASAIQIPFYVGAGAESRRSGRRLARRTMHAVRVVDVFAVDRALGAEALLLKLDPLVYELVFRATRSRRSR